MRTEQINEDCLGVDDEDDNTDTDANSQGDDKKFEAPAFIRSTFYDTHLTHFRELEFDVFEILNYGPISKDFLDTLQVKSVASQEVGLTVHQIDGLFHRCLP